MDLFRQKPANVPQGATPQNNPASQNPTVPSGNSSTEVNQGDKNPVDKYKDLWQVDDKKTPQTIASLVPSSQIDPAKLLESAGKLDFTADIPAELLQKAMSGDAASFMEVLQKSNARTFAQAVAGAQELQKRNLTEANESLRNSILPDAMRQQQIRQEMAKVEVFQDPMIRPMVDLLERQMASKFPDANPQQVTEMAQDYWTRFAQKIVPGSQQTQQKEFAKQDTDWSKFFPQENF